MKVIAYAAFGFMLFTVYCLVWWYGYRCGFRRQQKIDLHTVGLSTATIQRYRETMTLLNGMVAAATLDGLYVGNMLTPSTEREICRILDEHRKEIGIDK